MIDQVYSHFNSIWLNINNIYLCDLFISILWRMNSILKQVSFMDILVINVKTVQLGIKEKVNIVYMLLPRDRYSGIVNISEFFHIHICTQIWDCVIHNILSSILFFPIHYVVDTYMQMYVYTQSIKKFKDDSKFYILINVVNLFFRKPWLPLLDVFFSFDVIIPYITKLAGLGII